MNSITVHASREYRVLVGYDLFLQTGQFLTEVKSPCKVAIISETNVYPIYGHIIENSLHQAGYDVYRFVFPAGEQHKNSETYIGILNYLAENTFTRSDMLIALGGGVTGDITGFAAATFLRGISYIQIPTTLLAMVDSSVGGKTAIDLPSGKNLVGAFYQPNMVICDLNVLKTLPESIFCDGCAEVIKYGLLYDPELFTHLLQKGLDFDKEYVIARCIELKQNVVQEDEYDTGARQKLNLGHTIGHGIEAHSDFTISHGQAVAIGMAIVSKAAAHYGICDSTVHTDICKILNVFHLPSSTTYTAQELFQSALTDKKRSGGTVNLIIPEYIGSCLIRPTPVAEVKSFIEAGL